jgi:hypothetical protein
MLVDVKDDQAMRFYRKYGFLEVPLEAPNVTGRLFLPMPTIEQLFHCTIVP